MQVRLGTRQDMRLLWLCVSTRDSAFRLPSLAAKAADADAAHKEHRECLCREDGLFPLPLSAADVSCVRSLAPIIARVSRLQAQQSRGGQVLPLLDEAAVGVSCRSPGLPW